MADSLFQQSVDGLNLYVILRRKGSGFAANTFTQLLEAYNLNHWYNAGADTYAIAATASVQQANVAAEYSVVVPSWLPAGSYIAWWYKRLGATPNKSDGQWVFRDDFAWNGSAIVDQAAVAACLPVGTTPGSANGLMINGINAGGVVFNEGWTITSSDQAPLLLQYTGVLARPGLSIVSSAGDALSLLSTGGYGLQARGGLAGVHMIGGAQGVAGMVVDGATFINANAGGAAVAMLDSVGGNAMGLSTTNAGGVPVLMDATAGSHAVFLRGGNDKDIFHAVTAGTGQLFNLVFNGITSLANWLRAMARSSAPDATALTELNTTGGDFASATHSLEAISAVATPGLSGPSQVTLTFHDDSNNPVPYVEFTVVGKGPARANGSGVAVIGLANGTYSIVAAPTNGVTFAPASVTVAGVTAQTITGTAAVLPTPTSADVLVAVGQIYGPTVAAQKISYRIAVPPASISGGIWDGTTQTAISDSQGRISVELYKGSEYEFWWGESSKYVSVVVPTSGTSMTLPTLISPPSP